MYLRNMGEMVPFGAQALRTGPTNPNVSWEQGRAFLIQRKSPVCYRLPFMERKFEQQDANAFPSTDTVSLERAACEQEMAFLLAVSTQPTIKLCALYRNCSAQQHTD